MNRILVKDAVLTALETMDPSVHSAGSTSVHTKSLTQSSCNGALVTFVG